MLFEDQMRWIEFIWRSDYVSEKDDGNNNVLQFWKDEHTYM